MDAIKNREIYQGAFQVDVGAQQEGDAASAIYPVLLQWQRGQAGAHGDRHAMYGAGDLQILARRGRGREIQQFPVPCDPAGYGTGECARGDGPHRAELFQTLWGERYHAHL